MEALREGRAAKGGREGDPNAEIELVAEANSDQFSDLNYGAEHCKRKTHEKEREGERERRKEGD